MPNSRSPAERETLIKSSLDFFVEYILPKRMHQFNTTGNKHIHIAIIKDAEKIISEYYAQLMEKYFAPHSIPQTEVSVELYKVLSAIEYAIMDIKPFEIHDNNNTVHDGKHERLVVDESIINAHFAFNCALIMLSNSDDKYNKLFSNSKIMNTIINFKEGGESIGEEHIAILAHSTATTPLPLFSNASWWQLFCYAGTLLEIDGSDHPFG